MKKIIKIICILIIVSLLIFISYAFLRRTSNQSFSINDSKIFPSSENFTGTIEGSLGYPSEYIPEMKICAENIKNKEEFCSYEMIEDEKFIHKIGYQIKVPTGSYNVYSQLIDENKNDLDDYKAYYTKFVTCGMSIECKSHKKIDIEVKAQEKVENINPIDWNNY